MVVNKVFLRLFLTKVFERVGPKDVAHETVSRRLAETVDLQSILVCIGQTENMKNVRS
jgi:hypothetical protein